MIYQSVRINYIYFTISTVITNDKEKIDQFNDMSNFL